MYGPPARDDFGRMPMNAPARDDFDRKPGCTHFNGFGYGPMICCGNWCRAAWIWRYIEWSVIDLVVLPSGLWGSNTSDHSAQWSYSRQLLIVFDVKRCRENIYPLIYFSITLISPLSAWLFAVLRMGLNSMLRYKENVKGILLLQPKFASKHSQCVEE